MPAPKPPEFRRRALDLVEQGEPVAQVARNLGISVSCLRRWMEQDAVDAGRKEGLTSAEKRELVELRRKNRGPGDGDRDPQAGLGVLRPGERAPKMRFRLAQELADDGFDVAVACRVLGVSRSGYYDWSARPPSARAVADAELVEVIQRVHYDSRCTYGAPRVHAELRIGMGLQISRKRVARLMRQEQISGISHHRKHRGWKPAPATHTDLVQRRFTATAPDRV
jgi:transposase-like protein